MIALDEADSKTLITKLYNLNLLDWNEHYEPDKIIMDGESWDLEIDTYNLGHIEKTVIMRSQKTGMHSET